MSQEISNIVDNSPFVQKLDKLLAIDKLTGLIDDVSDGGILHERENLLTAIDSSTDNTFSSAATSSYFNSDQSPVTNSTKGKLTEFPLTVAYQSNRGNPNIDSINNVNSAESLPGQSSIASPIISNSVDSPQSISVNTESSEFNEVLRPAISEAINSNSKSISSDFLPLSSSITLGLQPLSSVSPNDPQGLQDYLLPPKEVNSSVISPKENSRSIKLRNVPVPKLAGTKTQEGLGITSISNAEVFTLSSNPFAAKTIYLDFDGYNTSATAWNDPNVTSSADLISSISIFSLDSTVSTSYSQAELDAIKEIFLRVAADYAPFGVNVTTATPSTDQITRSNSSDSTYGTVVAIGNIGSQFSGAGGIAYIGIYDSVDTTNYYKPALVFPSRLGNAKNIAEAASHEAGHNLNLSHDGQGSAAYYEGGGSSPGWAPIMGVGYSKQLTQFSRGQYSNATNTENDFVKIAGEGVGRYVEGPPNTDLASAETINLDSTGFGGVYRAIELASDDGNTGIDYDYFKFTAPASGSVNISVNNAQVFSKDGTNFIGADLPAGYGNLHLDAQILNASGSILADWNNNALVDVTGLTYSGLIAGQNYFVKVGPNSTLPDQSFGETTWGSLGYYALRIDADSNSTTPTLAIAATNANQTEGNSGSKAFTFTVTRAVNTTGANNVNWAVTGSGTNAANATDFAGGVLPSGTVSFAAGETSKVITVNIQGDTTVEPNENFTVTLSNPTNGATITTATAVGTIQNDDGNTGNTFTNSAPISIDDELSGGTTPYPSTISVSGLSGNINNLKVTLNNVSHTWIGDVDLLLVGPTGAKSILMSDVGESVSVSGVNLTFDASASTLIGDSNVGVSGSYKPNNIDGGDSDLFNSPAPGGPYNADLSIFNNTSGNGTWSLYAFDDFQFFDVGSIAGGWSLNIETTTSLPVITVVATDASAAETATGTTANPGQFTLTRTGATTSALTVNVLISGTATNGTDHTTIPTTVTFSAGSATAVVPLNVIDDTLVEGTETVILTVGTGTGYSVGTTPSATVNIADNDVAVPVITITATNATQTEGNSGTKAFTFTVTRAVNTTGANAVNWAVTGSGTNPANATDFAGGILPTGTVSFAVGETSKVITVNVQGDTTVEPDENFTVTLSNPTNGATITTATAIGTVQNDDNPPTITLDADGNGVAQGTTDGILIARYLFGFTGTTLTNGAIGSGATRTTATDIQNYLQNGLTTMLDADGNGVAQGTTDGILIARYLFGFTGTTLTNGAIGSGATRTTDAQIQAFLATYLPASTVAATVLTQNITATPSSLTVIPGGAVSIKANYSTSDNNTTLQSSFGFKLHYSSSKLNFVNFANPGVFSTGLAPTIGTPEADTLNEDNDASTDKVINVAWLNFNGVSWPNVAFPVTLYNANFTAASTFTTGITNVNFSSTNASPGYTFQGTGAVITAGTATVPVITVAATDANAAETLTGATTNPGSYTLTRTGDTTSALTVNVAMSGTATNGTDYTTIPTTVTFAAGSTTAVVPLNVIDDTLGEGTETAILTVGTGTDYSVGTTPTATVNITDNDLPVITVAGTGIV